MEYIKLEDVNNTIAQEIHEVVVSVLAEIGFISTRLPKEPTSKVEISVTR
jgi:hypothetical protein